MLKDLHSLSGFCTEKKMFVNSIIYPVTVKIKSRSPIFNFVQGLMGMHHLLKFELPTQEYFRRF